ncbi:hypothetical protein M513_10510 [Trichuris suis]|uniref:Reverse transcriptase domain-containing protein n=1 Tax=Trichuris suis TaxID=68888 RepID=A0A085LUD0_9BILA|nr:hypothetical protein M513_10510 [Trichuris suis]
MQKRGAPMGSPLSPVLAEVFMKFLEDVAFSTADTSIIPTVFKRYVDDVFAVIKSGKEEIFLEHLNSIFPNHISFTIEKEENGRPLPGCPRHQGWTQAKSNGLQEAHTFEQVLSLLIPSFKISDERYNHWNGRQSKFSL